MTKTDPGYHLSRIHAEGWKAARALSVSDPAAGNAAKSEALNPYTKDPERARWQAGFASGL